MRRTRVLTEEAVAVQEWIELPQGDAINIQAHLGFHFRKVLTENTTLHPPQGPRNGQSILLMLKQDVIGGWGLTVHSDVDVLGSLPLDQNPDGVTFLELTYDENVDAWECRGVPPHASSHIPGGSDEVFSQGTPIADPVGGVTIDNEARTTIGQILTYLRDNGLIEP